ncbi:MAG: Flp pilus assembly protein CpaB [Candidatus Obscuribacterales bacterium]|nr:Flp pilus assembly protein CpaB [Candidatus Obscuribacterales bacterium]
MAPLITPEPGTLFNRNRVQSQASIKKIPPMRMILLVAVMALLVLGGVRMVGGSAKQPAATVRVVAAGEDLPPGCKVGFTSLHYTQLPKDYFSEDMFTSYQQLVGSTTCNFVRKGEPIVAKAVLPFKQTLAGMIGAEARAVTLKLDPDALVDNTIEPGDRVDVLVTVVKEGKRFTRTVCQNLQVLLSTPREMMLVDRFRSSDSGKVTLSASPEDTERLTEALESGRLRLVLRNRANTRQSGLTGASEKDILPADALKADAPPALPPAAPLTPPMFAPPPPAAPNAAVPAAASAPDPVKWIVEVVSGSKKESCEVPSR